MRLEKCIQPQRMVRPITRTSTLMYSSFCGLLSLCRKCAGCSVKEISAQIQTQGLILPRRMFGKRKLPLTLRNQESGVVVVFGCGKRKLLTARN